MPEWVFPLIADFNLPVHGSNPLKRLWQQLQLHFLKQDAFFEADMPVQQRLE
jgi:hypothetical protein